MVPDYLRRHLESLGARMTPLDGDKTHVYIPGADHEYVFNPHHTADHVRVMGKRLEDKDWGAQQGFLPIHDTDPLGVTHATLNDMARGEINHEGPHHTIQLYQHAVPQPYQEGQPPSFQLNRGGLFHRDLSEESFSPSYAHDITGDYNHDDTEAGLVHGAFHQRPNHFLHPLLDYLAEKHRHELSLIRDTPHQYSRDLEEHYNKDIEPLI